MHGVRAQRNRCRASSRELLPCIHARKDNDDEDRRGSVLADIAVAQAKVHAGAGDIAQATAVAQMIRNDGTRVRTLADIAKVLAMNVGRQAGQAQLP